MEIDVDKESDFLKSILLTSPESGKALHVTDVRGKEAGLDHLEITTESDDKMERWKYSIKVEEV